VTTHVQRIGSIEIADRYNRGFRWAVSADFGNEDDAENLSPTRPQGFVHNLCITYPVGGMQRREIKQWRGLQACSFDYNEIPTSSCQSFCWKARH
jgi:hypothetical protein